jgi:hypothetical protein
MSGLSLRTSLHGNGETVSDPAFERMPKAFPSTRRLHVSKVQSPSCPSQYVHKLSRTLLLASGYLTDGLQIAWSLRIMHCGMAQVLVAKKGNVPEAEIPTRPSAYPGERQGHFCDHGN